MIKRNVLLLTIFFSSQALASVSEDLGAKLAAQDCLAADFEQVLSDINGVELQRSSGSVAAAKPNKLRWEITAPDTQLIVSDGETLWRYEEDLEQLIVAPFDKQGAGLPARILSGDQAALEAYDIQQVSGVYQLTPKQPSDLFQLLSLSFDDTGLAVIAMTDSFEQITKISLSHTDMACNCDALYTFEAPEGIDVIYE